MIGKIIFKETLALLYHRVFQKIKLVVENGNYNITLPDSYLGVKASLVKEELGRIYAKSSNKKASAASLYDILSFYVNGKNSMKEGFFVENKTQKEHIENFLLFAGDFNDVKSFLEYELKEGTAAQKLVDRQLDALAKSESIDKKSMFGIGQNYAFDENKKFPIAHYWCFLSEEKGVKTGKLGIYEYDKKNKTKRVCVIFPNKRRREDKYYGIMLVSDGKATVFLSKHTDKDGYDDEYNEYAILCLNIGNNQIVYKSEADIFWGIFAGFNNDQYPVYGNLAIQTPNNIKREKLENLPFSDLSFFNEEDGLVNPIYYEISNKRKILELKPTKNIHDYKANISSILKKIVGSWQAYSLAENNIYKSFIEIKNDLTATCYTPHEINLNGIISHLDEDKLILYFSNKSASKQFYIVLRMHDGFEKIEGCYIGTLKRNLSKAGAITFERDFEYKKDVVIINARKQPQEYVKIKNKLFFKQSLEKNYDTQNSLIGKKWYIYRLRIKKSVIPTIARSVLEIIDNSTARIHNVKDDKNDFYEGTYSYLEKVIVFDLKTEKGDKVLHIQVDYQNPNQSISLGAYLIYEEGKTVRGAVLFDAKESEENLKPAILSRKNEAALFQDLDNNIKSYLTFKKLNYATVPRGIETIDGLNLFLKNYNSREEKKRKNRFLEQKKIKVFISSPSTSVKEEDFQINRNIIEEVIVSTLKKTINKDDEVLDITYLKTNKIGDSDMPVPVPISLKNMLTTRFFVAFLLKTDTSSFSLVQLGWALAHCKDIIVFYEQGSISEQIIAIKDMEGVSFNSFKNFAGEAVNISKQLSLFIADKIDLY